MLYVKISRLAELSILGIVLVVSAGNAFAQDHFNAKGSEPSSFTSQLQNELRNSLPFEDQRDFEESRRGFIAEPGSRQILAENGRVVWDMTRYDFLLEGTDFDSIHPSLQRQATLNMNFGLYEVVPDFIYQVRGFDLANMTLVRGESGWILFDVLLTSQTAAAALGLANEQLGELPVRAVVYSHSHIDHFGGVRGVISEQEEDGSWFGRWGVNYVYGAGAVLPALEAIGEDMSQPYVRRAVDWLVAHQNEDGGWGESCGSYVDPTLRGVGPSTASQTAWALLGLVAAKEHDSETTQRGLAYLAETQEEDGSWDEPYFTGTGFPGYGVGERLKALPDIGETSYQGLDMPAGFMINYHLYRNYWPLLALGRYFQAISRR